MTVLFRVDAGAQIGLGHLMRCQALAQALVRENVDILFISRGQTQSIALGRHDWVGRVVNIPEDITIANEPAWISKLPEISEIDFVVLDGYQFNAAYRQQLRQSVSKLVVFDDNNDSGQLYADLIINGAANASELGYASNAPQASLCLGSQYRVLRQEFIQLDAVPWEQRHSLCIMMGGSDPMNLTLPLLSALEQQNATMPIRVMTGAAYAHQAELAAFIQQSPMAIQHLVNCQQVAEIFSYSRLVISAAGGSQFEALACHTPTVLIVIADNQRNATLQSVKQGWCQMVDGQHLGQLQQHLPALATQIMLLWENERGLQHMHQQAQVHADTQGCQRVLLAISEMLGAA